MSWKIRADFARTATFRLTVWYAVLFGTLSLAAFVWVYWNLSANLRSQVDLDLQDDIAEFEALYQQHGMKALQREFRREAEADGTGRVFMRLVSPQGKTLAASDLGPWQTLPPLALPASGPPVSGEELATVSLPGRKHGVRTILKRSLQGNLLQLGTTLTATEALMQSYRKTFGGALAAMMVSGAIVGWLLARRAMAGVERVTQAARTIAQGDLSRRVHPGKEGQEIVDLALAFNRMLERIHALVGELKEVTDNIAHDLRSPLTRIRGIAETTLTGAENLDAYREMAATVIEESDRLVQMINTMLEIAQADAGVAPLSMSPVDMAKTIKEARDLFLPVAEEKKVVVETDLPDSPLWVMGDQGRLQRVIANLLDNAVKYTPPGGKVRLAAADTESGIRVDITDTGPGIPEADLPRIFDRFYRGDKSRTTQGSGLGLSLAQAVVRAHGGRIEVRSSPLQGSRFTLCLPRSSDA